MGVGSDARNRAENYRKAVRYLDTCGELTLDKLRKATQIAGVEMESDLRRMWSQADAVLPRMGEPGGKEFVRFTVRKTLLEGIQTFDALAKQLGASKSSGCFIATAACGSDQAEDVVHLQDFRDTVLRPRLLGTALVTAYEACSPPVARFIARSSLMRFAVRLFVVRPAASLARLGLSASKSSAPHDRAN